MGESTLSPLPDQTLLRSWSPAAPRAGSSSSSRDPPSALVTRPSRGAKLIGRAAGRRGPSMLVRETAALLLDWRSADWARRSHPVVALDIACNVAFAVATAAVIASTAEESPVNPLPLWLVGYATQCLLHVINACRGPARVRGSASDIESAAAADAGADGQRFARRSNTVISFLWWIIGFHWVVSGGEVLQQGARRLYWLAVVFLVSDVFFVVFCVAVVRRR